MSGVLAALRTALLGPRSLRPGDAAPPFDCPDQDGRRRRLQDYRGRWLVLYFYPKDATPHCTREACNFRDARESLRGRDAEILGVSLDPAAAHRAFAVRYGLSFPLLADTDGALSRDFGCLFKLGPIRFARRQTFLIDPNGRIARIYRRVDVSTHSADVHRDLKHLQQAAT